MAVPTPKEWCSVYSDQICAYIWVINNSGRQLSPAMHANFEVRLPVEITSGFHAERVLYPVCSLPVTVVLLKWQKMLAS